MPCSLCRGISHNKRTCPEQPSTASAVALYKMSADDEVLHATDDLWAKKQLETAKRAKAFELANWIPREKLAAMSVEEYAATRFYDPKDKKGRTHLRNMVASTMQSDKSTAGSTFERALKEKAAARGIEIRPQIWVDAATKPCPRKEMVHKIDGYISRDAAPQTLKDCYVISKKTTLKERWMQDLWSVPHCRKVLILTRETPNPSALMSMERHGVVCVYPHAPLTDATWSYDEFFRRMKAFQEGPADC
jgi:DTW domain-containing protein YfiP